MGIIKVMFLLLVLWSGRAVDGATLCLVGDFDAQVEHLLSNEMLSSEDVEQISMSYDDFQNTLRKRWDGVKVIVFGSVPTGLGAKTSDVDYYVQVPGYNVTADAYLVNETAKILYNNPEKFSNITFNLDKISPIITFYDVPLKRHIDLTFRRDSYIDSSTVTAYYLNLDVRHIPLAAIIKFWSKVHHLTGKNLLGSYSMYLLVLFYLQQKNMGPPGYKLQANMPNRIVNEWKTKELPYDIKNNQSLYELLGGFFEYYNEFNFFRYCVSPFTGKPIAKSDLVNIKNVPKEFSLFKGDRKSKRNKPSPIDTDICIHDIFKHNLNTAQHVDKEAVIRFIEHVKYAADMFKKLPKDRFLTSILVEDNHNETIAAKSEVEVHRILNLKCCVDERDTVDDMMY